MHSPPQSEFSAYGQVLTPNERIAQELQANHDRQQLAQGLHSWPALACASIDNWLKKLWQDATAAAIAPCCEYYLLSDLEELELWRDAVAQSFDGVLLATDSAAQAIMQTWKLVCQWGLDLQDPNTAQQFSLHDDSAFFLQCVQHFSQRCEALQAMSAVRIPAELARLPAACDGSVLMYGFEEIVPSHQGLLTAWGLPFACLPHREDDQGSAQPRPEARVFASFEAEISAAASWAKDKWASEKVQSSETCRIAVVVPELSQRRAEVDRLFRQVFEPASTLPESPRRVPAYNISAGQSLADAPLIDHALLLLSLNAQMLPIERVPELLYSPFFSHSSGDSLSGLCQLEQRLRAYSRYELPCSVLLHEAQYERMTEQLSELGPQPRCPLLAAALQSLLDVSRTRQSRPLDDWLTLFAQQLNGCGWPNARSLDSVEYQQLQHWHTVLEQLPAMAILRYPQQSDLSASQVLSLLQQSVQAHVFQAQNVDRQVQVLGLLEGAGLDFDYSWLSSMNDQLWPAPSRPSPYIPISMQRELRMPHCDSQREYQFSRQLFASYQRHGGELVCSYATTVGGDSVRASRFIEDFCAGLEDCPTNGFAEAAFEACREPDAAVPAPFRAGEEKLRGGTAIYEDQALCPYRAFARHRLKLRAMEKPRLGLDPRHRGTLLHDVMEAVWRELGSHSRLKAMSDTAREELVGRSTDAAIASLKPRLLYRNAENYLHLERDRLVALVLAWLAMEAEREPFTVRALESDLSVSILGEPATVRIDRIDTLEDGSEILLEYKSGQVQEARLYSEPPLAPQLPFYLCHYSDSSGSESRPASGAALCSLNDKALKWLGMGAAMDTGMPAQAKRSRAAGLDWAEQLAVWRQQLLQLEQDFCSGESRADPAQGKATCAICDFASVCRYSLQGAGHE